MKDDSNMDVKLVDGDISIFERSPPPGTNTNTEGKAIFDATNAQAQIAKFCHGIYGSFQCPYLDPLCKELLTAF